MVLYLTVNRLCSCWSGCRPWLDITVCGNTQKFKFKAFSCGLMCEYLFHAFPNFYFGLIAIEIQNYANLEHFKYMKHNIVSNKEFKKKQKQAEVELYQIPAKHICIDR